MSSIKNKALQIKKQDQKVSELVLGDLSGDETEPVVVFSDDEPDLDDPNSNFSYIISWREAKDYKLPFGKHKGTVLRDMISSRQRRNYLRYLTKWELIRPSTKSYIEAALKHYEHLNTTYKKYKN